MVDIERLRKKHKAELECSLQKVVKRLSSLPQVKKLILFGSYAQGREDLFTDLDLLVIMETDKPILERLREIYREIESLVDTDILVYTPEELELYRERPFFRRILTGGKVLYEASP